jgi:hypothetical protein
MSDQNTKHVILGVLLVVLWPVRWNVAAKLLRSPRAGELGSVILLIICLNLHPPGFDS